MSSELLGQTSEQAQDEMVIVNLALAAIMANHPVDEPTAQGILVALRLVAQDKSRKDYERGLNEAGYDLLTQLPQKRLFKNLMTQWIGQEIRKIDDSPKSEDATVAWVVLGDVNGLKQVNDSRGHAVGDNYLKEVVGLFKKSFRETDILARIGGDEFLAVCPVGEKEMDGTLVKRLLSIKGELGGTLAMGMAPLSVKKLYLLDSLASEESDELFFKTLIGQADEFMYRVKQESKVSGASMVYRSETTAPTI